MRSTAKAARRCAILAEEGLAEVITMKPFSTLAALIFLVVGIAHVWRALTGAVTVVALGYTIPIWVSWPAAAVALLLTVMLLRESRAT